MKKFLLLAFLFPLFLKAQTYTIPWAQQQPEWVFPFWFENGDGQKDTIYLYYQTGVDAFTPSAQDSVWGNSLLNQDTSHFYISTYGYTAEQDYPGGRKVFKASDVGFTFFIHHGLYPMKIKWDDNLLYDTILTTITFQSFPNISPKPIARIGGTWNHYYSPFILGNIESFIIADTAGDPCIGSSIYNFLDSVIFTGPANAKVEDFLFIYDNAIRPQGDGCIIGNVKEITNPDHLISCTSFFQDDIEIHCKEKSVDLYLYSLIGIKIAKFKLMPFQTIRISASDFPCGPLILKAISTNYSQTIKILKQ